MVKDKPEFIFELSPHKLFVSNSQALAVKPSHCHNNKHSMTGLSAQKSAIYYQHKMFRLVFSADLGKQRSALTTPFLTGVSEAVFRSKRPPKKGPEVYLNPVKRERVDREGQRQKFGLKAALQVTNKKLSKAHPAI